jgi:cytochrome c553
MKKLFILAFVLLTTVSLMAEKSGKEAYDLSCKACHGDNGAGGKDFGQGPNLTILKKEYIEAQFKVIRDGKRKGPGTVNMLKVLKESKLTEKEIQSALAYAIKLPKAKSNHKKIGDKVKGKAKYAVCGTCHGPDGAGYFNPGIAAPRIAGQADFYIVDMLKSFKAGHRGMDTAGGFQMRAMANAVLGSEEDMINVAAYIRSLNEKKK